MKRYGVYSKMYFEKYYNDVDWKSYQNLLSKVVLHGKPGRWLDIGAGLGFFTECAARFGIECIGLEGSGWAVKNARKRYKGLKVKQHFLENKLPFQSDSISTVVCYQILEHLPPSTAENVVKESKRVLVKGGKILVYSPSKFNSEQKKEKVHINLYSPKQLNALLRNAGFSVNENINSPRMLLGKNIVSKIIIEVLFRLYPIDILSDTANCIATN